MLQSGSRRLGGGVNIGGYTITWALHNNIRIPRAGALIRGPHGKQVTVCFAELSMSG